MGALPVSAQAGFFSNLLGKEVFASGNNLPAIEQNSQNMALLEPNLSALVLENGSNKDELNPNVDVNIVAETALVPVTGPLGVSDGTEIEDYSLDNYSVYVVRKGDTFTQIGEMFGITPDTIYSFNDIKKGEQAKEGTVLFLPDFSGVEHTVIKGQTLQGIANLYKVSVADIISANDIGEGAKIAAGEKLMIPGGNILSETKPKVSTSNIAKGGSASVNVSGYFIHPVPGSIKSRGVKVGHKGVDFAAPTGTPIRASASGRVLKAAYGWNGAFGNMAIIQHSNGTQTLYAHMSRIATSTGAFVNQGDVIGYVGNTGRSTGPHLHFEVRGARNPF